MLTRHAPSFAFALLLPLLAACGGGQRVSHVEQTPLYSAMTMGYAARDGILATEIRGQPFGDGPIPAETVAASMKPPGWHRDFRFTTLPPAGRESGYRLILRFNTPVDATRGETICANSEPGGFGSAGAATAVHGVFCVGPQLVSEARAIGGQVRSPSDPAFRSLTDAVLAEIMPAYNRQVPIDSGGCSEC